MDKSSSLTSNGGDKPKLIYLEWCDALELSSQWKELEELIELAERKDWIVCEAGWLLKETDEYILLASKRMDFENDIPNFANAVKIPKTWILKRVEINIS